MATWCSSDVVLLDERCPLPLDQPFTARQAERLGVPRGQLRRLLQRGLVRRVVQGVYAAAQAPHDLVFRALALHLVVSSSAVVTDRSAAWLHGVDLLPRNARTCAVPVSVHQRPGTRCRREAAEGGERMLLDSDVVEVHGLAVTSPVRTALDLGRSLWRFDALAALDQFLRLGVEQDELLVELPRFKGYRGVIQLRALVAIADGRAESVAESALRLHWYDAGLPRPELQWWVHDDFGVPIYRLDLALPDAFFAAEYDGVEFHTDTEHDEGRRGWLDRRDWHIEVFVKDDVYRLHADPGPRLRSALAQARSSLVPPTTYPTTRTDRSA
ncbi:MAG: type IV toxin-antitoxin system AbiEi family antitoxin domain-containing protein [Nocardioides sp.]